MNWNLKFFSEIDKYAVQSYLAIHNEDESKNVGDITKVNEKELPDFNMIVGGSPCFVSGTQVYTNKGYKNIEDLLTGDMVLTHKNRFRPVIATGGKESKVVELNVYGLYVTYVTRNHPYYIRTLINNVLSEPYWKEVKDITRDDFIGVNVLNNTDKNLEYDFIENCIDINNLEYKVFSKGNQLWFPFRNIVGIGRARVFNISVEEDESYTANNAIVHNCQDFSVAGEQKGSMWECADCGHKYNPLAVHYSKRDNCPKCLSDNLNKTRSSLLVEWLRIIRYKKPSFGIYENVKNIVGKRFRDTFDLFINELHEYGFNTHWKILNSKNMGVPQNRERLFLIIIKKDLDTGNFEFPEPFDSGIRLRHLLDKNVDESFYINTEKAKQIIEDLKNREVAPSTDKINIVGKINCSQDGIIVDPIGITATLTAGHGNCPKVIVNESSYNPCLVESISDNNIQAVGNVNPCGRGQNGIVYSPNGIVGTLTSGHGTCPRIIENELKQVGQIYGNGKEPNPQAGRVYSPNGISNTLTTVQKDNMLFDGIRIRKLIPKECFRLMSFTDNDFMKAKYFSVEESKSLLKEDPNHKGRVVTEYGDIRVERVSNSQLYKQAGNSIVVHVLFYILKNLHQSHPHLFENIELGSFFSGVGAFEKALDLLKEYIDSFETVEEKRENNE